MSNSNLATGLFINYPLLQAELIDIIQDHLDLNTTLVDYSENPNHPLITIY